MRERFFPLTDRIAEEHPALWKIHYFPKGNEIFLNHLAIHRESLLNYPTE